jgi:hypothetical protein
MQPSEIDYATSTLIESRAAAPAPADQQSHARLPLFDEPAERDRRIRLAAFYRYEARGRQPGREIDDWLAAEAEIDGYSGIAGWNNLPS